jgi:hypothetical protein
MKEKFISFLSMKGIAKLDSSVDIPNSFSPEYYVLLIQQARQNLSSAILAIHSKKGVLFFLSIPKLLYLLTKAYFSLQMTNELTKSYIHEAILKQEIKNETRSP